MESQLVFTDSRIISNSEIWNQISAKKSENLARVIRQLRDGDNLSWLEKATPVLWFAKSERYPPSDPAELFEHTELWYREVNVKLPYWTVIEKRIENGTGYGDHSANDVVTRLFERGGIASGTAGFEMHYDADQKFKKPAPLLWRLGLFPLFGEIQPASANLVFLPMEFWYHSTYNYTGIYFGNHFGDWESFLILFAASDINGKIEVNPVAYHTSAHGGGTWHCKKDLTFENGRLQLFSAVGTHATYATPGLHFQGLYPDIARRDVAWNAFEHLRPLVREPYYGFSGSWGATSFVHWMNGPIPPGPKFKFLPGVEPEKARAQFNEFIASCPL